MAIPVAYNLRNLVVRKTTTLMTALGIDVALLANNHTGDYGGSVVMETIASGARA